MSNYNICPKCGKELVLGLQHYYPCDCEEKKNEDDINITEDDLDEYSLWLWGQDDGVRKFEPRIVKLMKKNNDYQKALLNKLKEYENVKL